jgi:predicted nuclease with TOPRIM domain
VDIKAIAKNAIDKTMEQTVKQWIGKAILFVVPIIFMSGWQAFTRYKTRVILEPVRPELARLDSRIDSSAEVMDTIKTEQKRYARQNTRFQTVLVKKLGLEDEIKRIRNESKAKKAERAELEDDLESLGE